ncbi:hypothetical protein K503DRAFT_529392 [Rhizopogon vinicolor AM-OR11-026]|uniref:Uncharacterized protein n=1 Tax=Rhizopogon vinicolor AM-OR11-026 TaxID=1314800 RepID=A0A1B7ML67_9AGAM|nr:hypothetical protein K503DRAFT_529392 [Rhizopogon vinicolor AM-OR11-026]
MFARFSTALFYVLLVLAATAVATPNPTVSLASYQAHHVDLMNYLYRCLLKNIVLCTARLQLEAVGRAKPGQSHRLTTAFGPA